MTFTYTGDGELVAIRVADAAGTTTTTHLVAHGRYEQTTTRNAAGQPIAGPDGPSPSGKRSYLFGDRLVAVRERITSSSPSGTLHYLHQDHLGSTSLQTSGTTGLAELTELRGPFGQPWLTSGSSSTLATDAQYTGQRSFESGLVPDGGPAQGGLGSLVFYRSRWYSPTLGRFLQPDTMVPGAG